jgi:hypothetical protein
MVARYRKRDAVCGHAISQSSRAAPTRQLANPDTVAAVSQLQRLGIGLLAHP